MTESNQKTVQEWFEGDAVRYDDRQYGRRYRTFISDRHRAVLEIVRQLGLDQGARILDIACGPGRFLLDMAKGHARPVGIDVSMEMLRTSHQRVRQDALLVQGSGTSLPFASGSFDLANSSGFIEYLPDPIPFLRETLRILKPGGTAVITSTNRLSPAYLLSPLIEMVRRSAVLQRVIRAARIPVQEQSLRARGFKIALKTPARLRGLLREAGFVQVALHYHHLQLLPHPMDHLLPMATTACVNVTDAFLDVPGVRALAEGLLATGSRPAGPG